MDLGLGFRFGVRVRLIFEGRLQQGLGIGPGTESGSGSDSRQGKKKNFKKLGLHFRFQCLG